MNGKVLCWTSFVVLLLLSEENKLTTDKLLKTYTPPTPCKAIPKPSNFAYLNFASHNTGRPQTCPYFLILPCFQKLSSFSRFINLFFKSNFANSWDNSFLEQLPIDISSFDSFFNSTEDRIVRIGPNFIRPDRNVKFQPETECTEESRRIERLCTG